MSTPFERRVKRLRKHVLEKTEQKKKARTGDTKTNKKEVTM
jgi:hypothetical protein